MLGNRIIPEPCSKSLLYSLELAKTQVTVTYFFHLKIKWYNIVFTCLLFIKGTGFSGTFQYTQIWGRSCAGGCHFSPFNFSLVIFSLLSWTESLPFSIQSSKALKFPKLFSPCNIITWFLLWLFSHEDVLMWYIKHWIFSHFINKL